MSPSRPLLIVGASLAGTSAAGELRNQGFDGRIVMLGAESLPPYLRPPLSKKLLTGEVGLESVWVKAPEWYADHEIELRTASEVTSVDVTKHTVHTNDGESIAYHRLLLATGSRPRRLALPGFDHPDVRQLRTLGDAMELHDILSAGSQRVALIGSGWIGLEVAAAARQLGNDVTVLDRNEFPLSRVLGREMGRRFAEVHRSHGVRILGGVRVDEVVLSGERVSGVRYDGTGFVPADVVIVGVGAIPNVELAQSARLDVDDGVLVDEYLRSSDPDIFAAGDIARAWHPVIRERVRSEHWLNAIRSGKAAGRSMMDRGDPFVEIPYFYTDQFEIGMEYSGYPSQAARGQLVIRGDLGALEFIAFWILEGRVVAGMNVNVAHVNEQIQNLIRSRRVIAPAALAGIAPLDQV